MSWMRMNTIGGSPTKPEDSSNFGFDESDFDSDFGIVQDPYQQMGTKYWRKDVQIMQLFVSMFLIVTKPLSVLRCY